LTGPDRMMPYIAPDYFRREMLIDLLSVHDISRITVLLQDSYKLDGKQLKESLAVFLRYFIGITTWLLKK